MQRVKIVLKLFLLLLVIYLLLRITFGLIYFRGNDLSLAGTLSVFYWGTRMDIAALFYINILFLLWYFLINPFLPVAWQIRLSVFLFSLVNLPFIALNFIDLVYFRYNLRRSTIDIFYVLGDSIHSFGSLFRQYWYVLLAFIAVSILFVYIARRILRDLKAIRPERWYTRWLAPLAFTGVFFLIAWGWGSRPIMPSTAILYTEPVMQPWVNNSTLNLLYSGFRTSSGLERKNYFTEQQLDSIYTIRRQYKQQDVFQKKNVVIFVLESFSADFFTEGPEKARTPFFDSLLNHSTICVNAYTNGHESVKGLTAILGSIPPFTDRPLFLSEYNAVPFNGIGSILKKEGYNTNFFHGAEYDHFNFAKLCRMAGIDDYYSKTSYGHSEYDDGNWGIYDEYFFNYFADITEKKQQPFLSVLFNTSSHPPFAIPAVHKGQFNIPGQRAQLNAITYVDHCFRQLFDRISKQPWFANTVFVFCADHTLLDYVDYKSYMYKACHIPLFIYDPQHPVRTEVTRIAQQLDIVPTVLNKLHYAKPFMSFGNDFLDDSSYGFSISRNNDGYQLIDSTTLTSFDDRSGKVLYHYNYKADSALTKNSYTPADPFMNQRVDRIKAILQRFNNSLLDQRLLIKD
jgi:phosphoglycerol transferase MdoB-like AlkP superfamily enzyme